MNNHIYIPRTFVDEIVTAHDALCPELPLQSKTGLNFAGLELAGEAGELANVVKKMWRGDLYNDPDLRRSLEKEVGDVMICLIMVAAATGVSIARVTHDKFDELLNRPTNNWDRAKEAVQRLREARDR